MEKLYILGGNGFIGKNLVAYLANKYKITVFSRSIDSSYFSKFPSVETLEIDLAKTKIPPQYSNPNFIINLVSIVTAERKISLFDEMISSNLKVLLNVFDNFKDNKYLKLFIQFGSSEEYGPYSSPFEETLREHPNSPYALVKQLTSNTAIMLFDNYGFPSMVVRPGNIFGPVQNKNKFIPYIIDHLKKNTPLNVSPCEQKRDFIYSDDFVRLISLLLDKYQKCLGKIVNVSSGTSISLKEVIEFCKKELGSHSAINYGAIPYRENEIMDLKCSIDSLSQIIGFKPQINIKKKLKEYIEIEI